MYLQPSTTTHPYRTANFQSHAITIFSLPTFKLHTFNIIIYAYLMAFNDKSIFTLQHLLINVHFPVMRFNYAND